MAIEKFIINKNLEGEKGAINISKAARKYDGNISITKGNKICNSKSLLGVLSLGLKKGDEVIIDVYENILNDSSILNEFINELNKD